MTLWEEYDSARKAVPPSNLVEVSYEQLVADPPATLQHIYQRLSLPGYEERVKARVEAAAARPAHKEYRVNELGELPPDLKRIVATRWAKYTKAWGYEW